MGSSNAVGQRPFTTTGNTHVRLGDHCIGLEFHTLDGVYLSCHPLILNTDTIGKATTARRALRCGVVESEVSKRASLDLRGGSSLPQPYSDKCR